MSELPRSFLSDIFQEQADDEEVLGPIMHTSASFGGIRVGMSPFARGFGQYAPVSYDTKTQHTKREKIDQPFAEPDTYSETLQTYRTNLLKRKPLLSQAMNEIPAPHNKSEEYEQLESLYYDCMTHEWCNVPVRLNGQVYDLATIEKFDKQEDPFSRVPFKKLEVQAAFDIVRQLDAFILECKKAPIKPVEAKAEAVPAPAAAPAVSNPSELKDREAKNAEEECTICMKNKRIVTNVTCGHTSLCLECTSRDLPAQCPICRKPVTMWLVTI